MCNIHVIIPMNDNINKSDVKEMIKMLERSGEINDDGYGIFSEDNDMKSEKQFKPSSKLKNKLINKFVGSKFLIGHNRLKTVGDVKKENSHPFETKDLMYVHNGSISNWESIKDSVNELEVDSQAIGICIQKELDTGVPITIAIKNGLSKLEGYLSLVIYYKPENKLYYCIENANFAFHLFQNNEGRKVILGNTIQNNIDEFGKARNKIFGFPNSKYMEISKYPLLQNKIYELNKETGIKSVSEFVLKEYVRPVFNSWTRPNGYREGGLEHMHNLQLKEIRKDFEEILEYQVAIKKNNEGCFNLYTNKEVLDNLKYKLNLTFDDMSMLELEEALEKVTEYKTGIKSTTMSEEIADNERQYPTEDKFPVEDDSIEDDEFDAIVKRADEITSKQLTDLNKRPLFEDYYEQD